VFGIGLSRTGTVTLTRALQMLGLRARHFFLDLDRIDELDAAVDTPIVRAWPELDRRYPGSKFVLTRRDEAGWLDSCARHFPRITPTATTLRLRLDVYGTESFDAECFRAARRRHEREVETYFRRRPQDLLVMDICAGDGWERLCPFLGLPPPEGPFPHLNAAR
jgi:hypothetical protein